MCGRRKDADGVHSKVDVLNFMPLVSHACETFHTASDNALQAHKTRALLVSIHRTQMLDVPGKMRFVCHEG